MIKIHSLEINAQVSIVSAECALHKCRRQAYSSYGVFPFVLPS